MALITIEDLKDYLKVTSTEQDLLLTQFVDDAQSILEAWLTRTLESASFTEVFNGDGTDTVVLRNIPVTAVSEVLTSIEDSTEVDSTAYKFNPNNGVLKLDSKVFPKTFQDCRVKYTAGWTTSTLPDAVRMGLIEMAALLYKNSGHGGDRLGKQSVNQAQGSTLNYIHKLSPVVQKALSKYRVLAF